MACMVHANKIVAALFRTVFSRVELFRGSTVENKARGYDFFTVYISWEIKVLRCRSLSYHWCRTTTNRNALMGTWGTSETPKLFWQNTRWHFSDALPFLSRKSRHFSDLLISVKLNIKWHLNVIGFTWQLWCHTHC